MKLSKIIDPKFKELLVLLNSQKIPLKAAYKLKSINKKVDEELSKYEQVRVAALNSYGNKKEDGALECDAVGNVVLEGANATAFINELNDLLNLDIEIPSILVSELGDGVSITHQEMLLLDFIVE